MAAAQGVSKSTVNRLWQLHNLKPHLHKTFKLSRDPTMPERISHGLQGYLRTLPGYVDAAFDDEGNEKPPQPDQPMYDLQIARQQHGYLSMQFTRSLQMMADEYAYIFKAQLEHSIREKIMTLPDDTVVLPGHGPLTTVGQERQNNAFPA